MNVTKKNPKAKKNNQAIYHYFLFTKIKENLNKI